MPKQNRPLVRDGRIQGKRKRTDRSYLQPAVAPAVTQAEAVEEEPRDAADVGREAMSPTAGPAMPAEPTAAFAPPSPESPVSASARTSGRLPTAIRAIQQQGVRKRRDVDIQALAVRDTKYALHELRRIAILATMVVVTLVVLGIVLR